MNNADRYSYTAATAIHSTENAFAEAVRNLESTLREMRSIQARATNIDATHYDRAQACSSAIHYLSSNNNPRLDLLASAMCAHTEAKNLLDDVTRNGVR